MEAISRFIAECAEDAGVGAYPPSPYHYLTTYKKRVASAKLANLIPLTPFSCQEKGELAGGGHPQPPVKGGWRPSALPLAGL